MENKEFIKEKEAFFEQLEVGNDGTLFISQSIHEYSLKEVLSHAFTAYYYYLVNSIFGDTMKFSSEKINKLKKAFIREAQLSFSKILCYSDNARKVLKEMKYYEDEDAVDNDFDVVVYRSPKDNCVINFKEFINVQDNGEAYTSTLTTEVLRETYGADNFFVVALNFGYVFGIEDIKLIDLKNLTDREKEAFYGSDAQQVLGWIPVDLINSDKDKPFSKVK